MLAEQEKNKECMAPCLKPYTMWTLYRVGVQDCYRRRYTAVPIVVTLLLEQCGYSDSSQNVWNGQKRGQKPRIPRFTPYFKASNMPESSRDTPIELESDQ